MLKTDVGVAKNYLSEDEISELNILVNMHLDYAQLQAKRNKLMKMSDWVDKLDTFLQFNDMILKKIQEK
ncbi:RhuM family protein [Flavobacterium oncorhynchi]|uniref:RhuM family protein n=1 Tax=Flavobacterium oncorhynchi TaxID=728056 RepID=UPI003519EA2F